MARKTKTKEIKGPNGESYPIHMLHPQIVKGDMLVRDTIGMAEKLSEITEHYHRSIFAMVMAHLETTAAEYGEKWQGNAVLKSYDGTMQVEIDVQQIKTYDERLQIASEKIRSWINKQLELVSDPSIRKIFEQVSHLAKIGLRIDHKGNVDQKKLTQIRKFEFSDQPEWQEAMELISASERIVGTKRYIRFKKADAETGKLEAIPVDFSKF